MSTATRSPRRTEAGARRNCRTTAACPARSAGRRSGSGSVRSRHRLPAANLPAARPPGTAAPAPSAAARPARPPRRCAAPRTRRTPALPAPPAGPAPGSPAAAPWPAATRASSAARHQNDPCAGATRTGSPHRRGGPSPSRCYRGTRTTTRSTPGSPTGHTRSSRGRSRYGARHDPGTLSASPPPLAAQRVRARQKGRDHPAHDRWPPARQCVPYPAAARFQKASRSALDKKLPMRQYRPTVLPNGLRTPRQDRSAKDARKGGLSAAGPEV